jgi:hypothetical protein
MISSPCGAMLTGWLRHKLPDAVVQTALGYLSGQLPSSTLTRSLRIEGHFRITAGASKLIWTLVSLISDASTFSFSKAAWRFRSSAR